MSLIARNGPVPGYFFGPLIHIVLQSRFCNTNFPAECIALYYNLYYVCDMDNTKKSRVTTFRMWDHLKEDFQRIAEAEDRYYSKSDHINRAIEDYIKKQQGRLLRYGSESPKHNTK